MPKVKADYSDVEERESTYQPYDGDTPTAGTYTLRLVSCKDHTSSAGNEGFEWIFIIENDEGNGPFDGAPLYTYSNLTSTTWKTKQITDALGWTKQEDKGGTWDSDKEIEKGKRIFCRGRVKREMYEGEPKAKLGNVYPIKGDAPSAKPQAKATASKATADLDPEADPF